VVLAEKADRGREPRRTRYVLYSQNAPARSKVGSGLVATAILARGEDPMSRGSGHRRGDSIEVALR
jgi:hypothetical protein